MAEISVVGILGDLPVAQLSADEIANLNTVERAFADMGSASTPLAIAKLAKAAGAIQTTTLTLHGTVASGSTGSSMEWKPPFPVEVLEAQFACETSAGSASTATLRKNGTSILAAAVDIHTNLKRGQRATPEVTVNKVAYGDYLDLYASSTGGALNGVSCIITWRRQ